MPTPSASKTGRRSKTTTRNVVSMTKLRANPMLPKRAIAIIIESQPAKALAAGRQSFAFVWGCLPGR